MSKNKPFFSVILTSYNRAVLLQRAIRSLMVQTFTDWEGIIIDDGSTDNTFEMMSQLMTECPKLHYLKIIPSGATGAKNKGVENANGRFITFLDSDDEYLPEHLSIRKQFLEMHPDAQFLHGGFKVVGNNFVPDRFHFKHLIPLSKCAVGGTFVIDSNLYKNTGSFREMPLGSDADYLERLQQKNCHIYIVNNATYIYHRESDNSITSNLMKYG